MKDFRAATATFTTALKRAQEAGDRPLVIHARLYRGEAYFRDNRLDESAQDFKAAATDAATMGEREEEWKAEFGLARIALRKNDRLRGTELLKHSVTLIESLRSNMTNSSLRSAFLADKHDVYDLLIENSTNASEMFTYMEQSRARTLTDRIRQSHLASLEDAARELPDDTALVEYWMGDTSFAILWIFHGRSGILRRDLSPEERRTMIGIPALLADAKRTDWIDALGPSARKLLAGIPPLQDPLVKRLIIVPDRFLSALPFEALPFLSGLLIDRFTVSYLPASGILAANSTRKRAIRWFWQSSLEAFADPAPSDSRNPEPVNSQEFSRLPEAAREIGGIAESIGGRAALYSGASAVKARLLRHRDAPLLHFATHAFADLDNPDLSYILLAPSSSAQRYDYLFLKEVGDLPLKNVGLVTLSACQTGIGKDVPGEGIESFTRSFLAAGVPSVVTSLWAVPDRATSELMIRFYSRLAKGESVADALRGAKLEFIHSKTTAAHPSNWAAFVLTGDGRAQVPYVIGRKWLLLPIALLLLTVFAFRRRGGKAPPYPVSHRRATPGFGLRKSK